jgi:hypothetical protein
MPVLTHVSNAAPPYTRQAPTPQMANLLVRHDQVAHAAVNVSYSWVLRRSMCCQLLS